MSQLVSLDFVPFFASEREYAACRDSILQETDRVLETGQVLQGGAVNDVETAIAEFVGRRHAVAVGSGTDALFFSLQAAGVKSGNEVLVTDFSFVASASCIARLGAVPVFVDVDPRTLHLDFEKAAAAVTANTKAIVLVHVFGSMANPSVAEDFARCHGLQLVEDAAQAFGSAFDGRMGGSIGEVSCFSFDPTKPLAAPSSGGMVLTDDAGIAAHVRRLRYHGKTREGSFVEVGYNSQMSTLTAAVLLLKLRQSPQWQRTRQQITEYYVEQLVELDVALIHVPSAVTHCHHKFVLRTSRRDELRRFLNQQHVETRVHYAVPLHRQPCFRRHTTMNDAEFENTLACVETVVSLPIHAFLTDAEVERVCSSVCQFFHQPAKLVSL